MVVNMERLRELMYGKNVTIRQLSINTGIPESTIYRRFSNPEQFLYSEVVQIRDALRLTKSEFGEIFLP